MSLQKAAQPGHHQRFGKLGRDELTAARSMASYQVILQLQDVLLAHLILRHRPETGVYTVNKLVRRELFQKFITVVNFFYSGGVNSNLLLFK